jgi:hypothetical protein
MKNNMVVILLMACVCMAAQGCTYRAWYEGFQKQQREECYRQPSQEEIQKCLDKVNNMTYDQYTKARKDAEKKGE